MLLKGRINFTYRRRKLRLSALKASTMKHNNNQFNFLYSSVIINNVEFHSKLSIKNQRTVMREEGFKTGLSKSSNNNNKNNDEKTVKAHLTIGYRSKQHCAYDNSACCK